MKKILLFGALLISLGGIFTACKNSTTTTTTTTTTPKSDALAADETYTCTMHNEVMSDHPGKCPKCEMDLVKQKMTEEQRKLKENGNDVKPKE